MKFIFSPVGLEYDKICIYSTCVLIEEIEMHNTKLFKTTVYCSLVQQ